MSGGAPTRAQAAPGDGAEASLAAAHIRQAAGEDVAAVAKAVSELLGELGAPPSSPAATVQAVGELLENPAAGTVLMAEADGLLVGVLAASWVFAIHVPGSYALIQDLWVQPAWRSRMIGRELIAALAERARARGMARLEVGLPRERFVGFPATEAFYLGNGFEHLGPRMRRALG